MIPTPVEDFQKSQLVTTLDNNLAIRFGDLDARLRAECLQQGPVDVLALLLPTDRGEVSRCARVFAGVGLYTAELHKRKILLDSLNILRNRIQDRLLDPLATKLLRGEFKPGDRIKVVARDGELEFAKK